MQSDSELVKVALDGNKQAYGELFRRHERSVLAIALAILKNDHAAQDAAQDAFVAAYRHLGELRLRSSFGPWVRQIARRQALQVIRRTGRNRDAELASHPGSRTSNGDSLDEANRQLLEAVMKLPQHERIVITLHYQYGLSITYRWGNSLRHESYGKTDATHNERLPVDVPEDLENIRQWARDNLVLYRMTIFDGRYEYAYDSGDGLWDSAEDPGAQLHVQYHNSDFIDVLIPIRNQWPFVDNVGPMAVLENEPGTPAGCVLLRYEGLGLRRDWCVDPNRDYICVRQFEFRRSEQDSDLTETDHRHTERTNLTQLPSGQWYARTASASKAAKRETQFDVALLADGDVEQLAGVEDSADFFDGEKLLEDARDEGAHITFWAR